MVHLVDPSRLQNDLTYLKSDHIYQNKFHIYLLKK
jgi:hypothetical protein